MTEGPDGAACWLAEAFCGDRRGCHPRGFGRKRQGIRVCAEARAEVEDVNGASCSASVWLRWGAKQELGGGEPFDDVHSSTADWATPEWVSLIGGW
jgi:hypothetical protein